MKRLKILLLAIVRLKNGRMVERLMAPDSKSGDPKGSVGSNPTSSATRGLPCVKR